MGCAAAFVFFVLALFEAGAWTGGYAKARDVIAVLAGLALVLYGLLSVDAYPYGPLCVYLVGMPAVLALLHASLPKLLTHQTRASFDVFLGACTKPCSARYPTSPGRPEEFGHALTRPRRWILRGAHDTEELGVRVDAAAATMDLPWGT